MALLAYAGPLEEGERVARAVPRRWPRRSPTWCGRCPTRRSIRPTTRSTARLAVAARCSWTGSTAERRRRSSSASGARRADGGHPAARARRRHGARAGRRDRVRPPRQARSWPTSRRSPRPRTGCPSARPGSASSRPSSTQGDDSAPTWASSATRARTACARPTRGATWERLAQIKAQLRPGQRVPAQPEHPACAGRPSLSASTRQSASTDDPGAHLRRSDAAIAEEDRDLADPRARRAPRGR